MQGKYEIPKHLTAEAKKLLAGMLNVDPKKRMGIPEIRRSEFLQKYAPKDPSTEPNILSIDQEVLEFSAQHNELEPSELEK